MIVDWLTREVLKRVNWEEILLPHLEPDATIEVMRSEILHARVGEVYEIFKVRRPTYVWGYLDLSEARPGDVFQIRTFVKIGGVWRAHEEYELVGQQKVPMISMSSRFAPAYRVEFEQVRGIGKEIVYEWYGKHA